MIIEFGALNYKLLLPLLNPILHQIRKLYLDTETSMPLYDYFLNIISYLLSGIVYLIILYRSKSHNKQPTSKNPASKPTAIDEIYLENKNIIMQRKVKKFISIFLLSLINMIPMISKILISLYLKNHQSYKPFTESFGVMSAIIFFPLFSKVCLSSHIYRHQIISLILISFCSLIFLFIEIYQNNVFFNLIPPLIYFIIYYGFYALYDSLLKKHFEMHLNDPYQLMFFVGLFSFILLIPLDLLSFFIYGNNENEIYGLDIINSSIILINKHKLLSILLFLFDLVTGFFWLGGVILTIYYFTPCHLIISITFSQFLSRLAEWMELSKNLMYKKDIGDKWYMAFIYIFLYCIINFSSLLYNEVIIIRFCSLEKNTSKYISLRERLESEIPTNIIEENLTERISHVEPFDKIE